MNCPKCGAQNIDGVSFCGNCGSPMKLRTPHPAETYRQNLSGEGDNSQQPPPPPQQQRPQPQQTYTSQYGPYSGGPSNGGMVMPNNYMVEAIVVTVIATLCCCCCTPIPCILGIIAIVKASSVTSEFERGNMDQALRNAEIAKKLVIWAVVVAIVLFVASSIWSFFNFSRNGFDNEGLQQLIERFT